MLMDICICTMQSNKLGLMWGDGSQLGRLVVSVDKKSM